MNEKTKVVYIVTRFIKISGALNLPMKRIRILKNQLPKVYEAVVIVPQSKSK